MVEAEEIIIPAEAPAQEPPPKPPPRKLVQIIDFQLGGLRTYHRAVLDTESVEAVHKMRVTTRRLQASLDLLEREIKVRRLKRRLRSWRRKLSAVRNYDVFLDLIEKEAASRGRTRRAQLELVQSILHARRLQQSTKVSQFLQGININSIAVGVGLPAPVEAETPTAKRNQTSDGESLNDRITPGDDQTADAEGDGQIQDSSAGKPVFDEQSVAGYAAERLDQRLEEFKTLAGQSHPTNNPAELHQLRIAAKRVRYLLEIVSEMGFGDASRALAWLRTLQDRIGDWHDLEALEEEIIEIVSSREFMKQHLTASSQMLQAAAHLQKKKEALVSRLFPVRVPRYVELTSHRVARALRRRALQRPTLPKKAR